MPQEPFRLSGPRPGLLVRLAWSIAAVIVLVSAAFLGALVFLAVLGLFVVAVLVTAVRIWWLRRRVLRSHGRSRDAGGAEGTTIEGDFVVVRRPGERDGEHGEER